METASGQQMAMVWAQHLEMVLVQHWVTGSGQQMVMALGQKKETEWDQHLEKA